MQIVLTGPESCGKSTLADGLAEHFGCALLPEFARTYLERTNRDYLPSDLIAIMLGHLNQVDQTKSRVVVQNESSVSTPTMPELILDTDLQNLVIWWQEIYGPVPKVLSTAYAKQLASPFSVGYLLCAPDIAWQSDPLRENESDRERLFGLYLQHLQQRQLPYSIVRGEGVERLAQAIAGTKQLMTNFAAG